MKGFSLMRFSTQLLSLAMLLLAISVFTGCPSSDNEQSDPIIGPVELPKTYPETAPNELSEEHLKDGWISLFDGETLYGWQDAEGLDDIAGWSVKDGMLIAGADADPIMTTSHLGDFEVSFEYRRTVGAGEPEAGAMPFDPIMCPCQGKDGEWKKKRETCVESELESGTDASSKQGRFCLIGKNVEFQSIKIRPIGSVSLFNGENLDGWKTFPELPTEASVMEDGALQLLNGSGMIETEKRYGDFIFQTEAYIAVPDINSGVFFRCIPGDKMNGYESQLNNTVNPETGLPDDCGTGGIFHRMDARKIIAEDETWFHVTILAEGPHIATWVNGIQVCYFTDDREPHANPRNGLRVEPGTIQFQGHDPTTDVRFRNIRITEMDTE
jgi:hypothetical protein